MNFIDYIEIKYSNTYTNILYNEVKDLVQALSDEEFIQLCDNNIALISPISQKDGSIYLRQKDTLLKLRSAILNLVNY